MIATVLKRFLQIIMITAIVFFLMMISASKAELLVPFFWPETVQTTVTVDYSR